MRLYLVATCLFFPFLESSAFITKRPASARSLHLQAVELKPEPEGGQELTAVKTLDGSRMKNMGEADGVNNDNGPVYKFWLKANVEGVLVKEIHAEVLKESSKKANFPGFRKGQVPPYAMPQIRGFAVQEAIIRTCQSAVDAYGLKSLSGSDGEVEVLEDIPAVASTYKLGDDVQFTATFNAIFDPEISKSDGNEDKIVDVVAEEVAAASDAAE
jgi:FKBP-type peptidyl-prolyl cis-trans isomerase (trigger factor)